MLIIKPNNQTINLNNRKPLRSVTKAEYKQSLLSEDVIQLSVDSKKPINFNIGDKILHNGRYFSLNFAPKVKKEQGYYNYDLTFEGVQYQLRKKVFFNRDVNGFQTAANFSLTGTIDKFLNVLITNINTIDNVQWSLGEFPQNSETKTLTFNNENCLGVLQRICKEYDTEFIIVENGNTATLHIKKIGKNIHYRFEYGKHNGLYSLQRDNVTTEVVTRLYAYGSSQNIPINYREFSQRLRMPVSQGDYIQNPDKVNAYGLQEGIIVLEDIKPTFRGKINTSPLLIVSEFPKDMFPTTLKDLGKIPYKPINHLQFRCNQMNFDLKEKDENGNYKYLISGTTPRISITKGDLAGYEFDIVDYDHTTKQFTIAQFEDEQGMIFPQSSGVFSLKQNDEFTLLDIIMPPSYITEAENKLREKALEEYEKLSLNNTKYTLDLDPLFLKEVALNGAISFEIGDYIQIQDTEMNIDKSSRIISITQNMLEEHSYKLDVADTFEYALTVNIVNEIRRTQAMIHTQDQLNRQLTMEHRRRAKELQFLVFDTDGYFDPINIKPQSIETNMLSVGAKSQQFALENVSMNPNHTLNSATLTAGKLIHFSIDNNNVREWNISAFTANGLLGVPYYVYAKCNMANNLASWVVTQQKIKFDEVENFYHFLCFVIYTPINGKRTADAMYGNTIIHGGQISTGRISSTNGQTYFDLDTGEIKGKITFTAGSPALTEIQNAQTNAQNFAQNLVNGIEIGGRNLLRRKGEIIDRMISMNGEIQPWLNSNLSTYTIPVVEGEKLVFTKTTTNGDNHWRFKFIDNSGGVVLRQAVIENVFFITTPNNAVGLVVSYPKNAKVKIEKGTIPTDWTPAPEDVDASIVDIQTKTDNFTTINGGLVTSNIISVGSTQGNQNAFISGVTDVGSLSVRFGAGASYDNKNNAPFRVLDNGKLIAHDAEISGKVNATSGTIGGFIIGDNIRTTNAHHNDNWFPSNTNGEWFVRIGRNDFRYVKNIGGTRRQYVGIGGYMCTGEYCIGGQDITMRIENGYNSFAIGQNPPTSNTALVLSARNANYNTALKIEKGNISIHGQTALTTTVAISNKILTFTAGLLTKVENV